MAICGNKIFSGANNSFFGEGGFKEDGEEGEESQPALPVKIPTIHPVLVESKPRRGRRKVVSREFFTVYNEVNALWYFPVDRMSSPS